jgi:predicted nucleic acid-binding protein
VLSIAPIPVVVDASFAIEVLDGPPSYRAAWRQWIEEDRTILVPGHFWVEVGNALLRGLRLLPFDASARLERLAASGPEVADRGVEGVRDAIGLAEQHRLTVYDALYLHLALDTDAELATLDSDLAAAARATGITTIPV